MWQKLHEALNCSAKGGGGGGDSIVKHAGNLARRSEPKAPNYLSKTSNIKKCQNQSLK